MINIYILALKNAVIGSVSDSAHVFSKVNEFLSENGLPPLFWIRLVGLTDKVSFSNGPYTITPDVHIDEVENADLLIIPALMGNATATAYLNKDYAPWIAMQYKRGVEVASLCTGAFLLGFSGVLSGKKCTTHWAYANEFRYYYPSVEVVDEHVITDQDGLYSSGGSNAYWNLLLYLVEKYTTREMAIRTAKFFVVDLDKSNQSAFIIFQGMKDHDDEVIIRVQNYIEESFARRLGVDQIAEQFHITRRTLERRFRKATRNTVTEYIQRVKVEAAKKMLETGKRSVNDIMVAVGYSDVQTFREVFKWATGMTPIEYRNKYNHSGVGGDSVY